MSSSNDTNDMREFLLIVRRALIFIVRWIEKKYGVTD